MDKPHKTAIKRNKLSVPAKFYIEKNILNGRCLDYGCGHGFDADHIGMEKWDPYWNPTMPDGKFDTIVCNYVFNVIPPEKESEVIDHIISKLNVGGKAYITVRRDISSDTPTQRLVYLNLPKITDNNKFCTYVLSA